MWIALFWCLAWILSSVPIGAVPAVSECEKRMHNSFTAQQKKQLCDNTPTQDTKSVDSFRVHSVIGPAICAGVAKDVLHAKFDEILALCKGATSAAPAQCMSQLDNTAKKKYGIELCSGATSTLPGECFAKMSKFGGGSNQVKPDQLLPFCKNLLDRAPLQCVLAVKDTSLLPVHKSLDICEAAVGAGSSPHTFLNDAAESCIEDMKPFVNPSFGLQAEAILQFCVAVNPRAYAFDATFEDDNLYGTGTSTSSGSNIGGGSNIGHHNHGAMLSELSIEDFTLTESSDCFQATNELRGTINSGLSDTGPALFNGKQRLRLCENAPDALGPVNCTTEVLTRSTKIDPTARLKIEELVDLCTGARGAGPAKCFVEGRNLGAVRTRINLCNGAVNAGPAQCYRRTSAAFKGDEGNRTLLCVSAETEDPAVCANAAPHYLSPPEKVDLCAFSPPQRGQDASKCMTAVESVFRQFANAPKKALGYFLDNLWDKNERISRELLVHMCSFSGSQDPLAAAECLKSAPKQLEHDDAVRMCTNISSLEVIEHMQLCHRILPPRQWQSEEAAALCEHTESRLQVEAAVKCAMEVIKLPGSLGLSKINAGRLCSRERPPSELNPGAGGPVLACAKEISKIPASSPGYYLISPESLLAICSKATSNRPGQCLAKLASIGSSRLTFDANVPEILCALDDPLPIIACLEKQSKKMINADDVDVCVNTKQEVRTVKVSKLYTEDNDIEVTAGRRFLIWFTLLDQWGRKFIDKDRDYMFSVSLNPSNPQGAVIWGLRSNYSQDGMLQLNSLVISQPGPVELRLSYRGGGQGSGVTNTAAAAAAAGGGGGGANGALRIIESFNMVVKEDESVAATAPCVYVFKQAACPAGTDEGDWLAEFPRIRSFSPANSAYNMGSNIYYANYLRNIQCAGEVLQTWHVNAYIQSDGSMWVEYRMGIDAIWTGIGMPKMEMGPEERLGVIIASTKSAAAAESTSSDNKKKRSSRSAERAAQKELRRAYYRKSLQWHPDRWVGMSMYTLAVQGAFELITEAYQKLTGADEDAADGSENGDAATARGPTPEENPSAYA